MAFPKLAERDVSRTCLDWLRAKGFRCYRLQSGMVRGWTRGTPIRLNANGTPDLLCVRAKEEGIGCFDVLFVEFKRKGGKVRAEQITMHVALRQDGFTVLLAD